MSGSTRRWPALCLPAVMAIMVSACNGSGTAPGTASNGILPPTSQGAVGMTKRLSPIVTYPGAVFGEPKVFRPHQGDSKAGGRGKDVDGIPCDTTEYLTDYHIHVYLGILYKDRQIAVPTAIGLMHPGTKENGYIATAGCYYWLHTHDSSGIVHVEDKRHFPPTDAIHTFGEVMSIWGVKLASDRFGPLKGSVHAYVGNVSQIGQLTVSKYTELNVKDVPALKLRSHEVLWLAIDSAGIDAGRLPPVTFYMEY
jgi:hypothetical protein